jgi:hypothetical protein
MRYAELVTIPGTSEEAKNSINDLVTVYLGDGESEIPMEEIQQMMHDQGWDLTPRMIMDVLQDHKGITKITKDTIMLKGGKEEEADESTGEIPNPEKQKAEKHVAKLAKKTLSKARNS